MKPILSALILLISISLQAQNETIFSGISFYQSKDEVMGLLEDRTSDTQLIKVESPSYPLAKQSESHVLARNLQFNDGTIDKVIFTFGDDKLYAIEAIGQVERVQEGLKDAMTRLGYTIYFSKLLFVKPEEDRAWQIAKDGLHPNLFIYRNPYLVGSNGTQTYNSSAQLPDFVEMGGDLEAMEAAFEKNADFIQTEELDGSDPNAQIQINAFGVEYAGFPRKFEARFGDEQLNMIWILTAKPEEARIRKLLTAAYGAPVFKGENWEVFDNWKISLRKDKPEVLVVHESLIPMVKEFVGQN